MSNVAGLRKIDAVTEAVAEFTAMKIGVVPLLPRTKKAVIDNWQEKTFSIDDFAPNSNIGIQLGKPIVDIDIDDSIVLRFEPQMPWREATCFGRASKPRSHYLVHCKDAKSHKFKGANGQVLIELRGPKHQTMVPPSVHPSGEVVEWHKKLGAFPHVEWSELWKFAALIAFLADVSNLYPREKTNRNDICLALAGTFFAAGFEAERTRELIQAIARVADDEETRKRASDIVRQKAKYEADEPVTGLLRLCELLDVNEAREKEWRKWLGIDKQPAQRPTDGLIVEDGQLVQNVDKAEALFKDRANDLRLFQRSGQLVTVAEDQEATRIEPVTIPWLRGRMCELTPWHRLRGKQYTAVDVPLDYAAELFNRKQFKGIPPLRGIARAPTLNEHGEVIEGTGYHALGRLWLDIAEGQFPPVPHSPSHKDAAEALAALKKPFRAFPFSDENSKAVVLSAILTGLVRPYLSAAPLHAFDAPMAGTGKTLAAQCVGKIVTGRAPDAMTFPYGEDEVRKRITAALLQGPQVVLFDNLNVSLSSDFLCAVLTNPRVTDRVLKESRNAELITTALFMATGNNLHIQGDMNRRTVVSRLDANDEHPEQRKFDFHPLDEIGADRAHLVVAGLIILRAYHVAGRPISGDLRSVGSFEEWSRFVRGALVWLGCEDPAESLFTNVEENAQGDVVPELIALWRQLLGSYPSTVRQIEKELSAYDEGSAEKVFLSVLKSLAPNKHAEFSPRAIGRQLNRIVDRVIDGVKFRAKDNGHGTKEYWVETPTGESLEGKIKFSKDPAPERAPTPQSEKVPF